MPSPIKKSYRHRPPLRHRLGCVQPVPVGPISRPLRPASAHTVEAADGPAGDGRSLPRLVGPHSESIGGDQP